MEPSASEGKGRKNERAIWKEKDHDDVRPFGKLRAGSAQAGGGDSPGKSRTDAGKPGIAVARGGEAFVGELKKKYEIDEVIKPKGRPKKKAQR